MAKHSIFSRDYERKMKRKRRRSILIILAVVLIVILSFIKFEVINMDFSNFRQRLQAWVDSGKTPEEINQDDISEETTKTPQATEKTYMDLKVSDLINVKAEYKEESGNKKFVSFDQVSGVTCVISPLGKQILITDDNQNLKIFNVDGTMKDITKLNYVSQSGVSYPKDNALKSTPSYIWHSQAKFLDETRIIYVSQLPYFGTAAVNKYIWILDTVSGTDRVLWNPLGPDTTIGDLDVTRGISVTVNGQKYFVTADGNYTSAEAPVEQAPAQQTAPVEQAPVEQAPAEQAPAEQAPVEQAPVEQAPVEQVPTVQVTQ